MNIDIIKLKHNNLYVVEFYDDYEGITFRLSGQYPRKKDADDMARKLNILFDKIINYENKNSNQFNLG